MAIDSSNSKKPASILGLGVKAAPRKELSRYKEDDFNAIQKDIEKDIELVTKLMLANMKYMDPFDDNQDMGKNVTDASMQIGKLRSQRSQAQMFTKLAEDIKDPGFSATELQDSWVSYDDSIRSFDGKSPITFNYNLSFPDRYKGGTAKTEIIIRNNEGEIVHKAKGSKEQGEHEFKWAGVDDKGNKMPRGDYTISVVSKGTKFVNGAPESFAVSATTVKKGKVAHVNVSKGKAGKLTLADGKIIDKVSIKEIKGKDKKVKDDFKVDVGMIEKKVSVDMSKIQIKQGQTEIKYLNEEGALKDVKIEIYNGKGKKVKEIDYKKKLVDGFGSIKLEKEIDGLEDGNYVGKISYTDPNNSEKRKYLEPERDVYSAGINRQDNKITDQDGVEFAAHSIKSVASTEVMSTLQTLRSSYLGKEVEYSDDEITWKDGENLKLSRAAARPDDGFDGMLNDSKLRIYDENNNLVKIVTVPFKPYDMLTDEAKQQVNVISLNAAGEPYGEAMSSEGLRKVNARIVERITDDGFLKPEFKKSFLEDKVYKFDYEWDGSYDPGLAPAHLGDHAVAGKKYHIEVENSHVDNNDVVRVSDETHAVTKTSKVVEFRELGYHQFELELDNGDVIKDERLIKIVRAAPAPAVDEGN